MIRKYRIEFLTDAEIDSLVQRRGGDYSEILPTLTSILEEVSSRGDDAVKGFTRQFDGVHLPDLCVSKEERARAHQLVDQRTKQAIREAAEAIESFHRLQLPSPIEHKTSAGVDCRLEWRPIQRVGLYAPGGSAPLISTVLMLGIPARIAGCGEIVLCTPPSSDGSAPKEILFAADSLGIEKVFKIGGAQAIAAMAVGTPTIPKVEKIFGPGNRYVTGMKSLVAQPRLNVAVDMLAGPTELLIIADGAANAQWIAADLLSQAEHGEDSHVALVTTSEELAQGVQDELVKQISDLPRRAIAQKALGNGYLLLVPNLDTAIEFSNRYAPEHLVLAVDRAESLASRVMNAGSVFLGSFASVVFGDYASGTNHTLPTARLARTGGGLTVTDFMKPIYFQTVTEQGVDALSDIATTLARAEGLEAHARAVEVRKGRA
jgi:histidinol dehydrogenase